MTDFGLLEKFVFMVQKNCLKLSISKVLSQVEKRKKGKRKGQRKPEKTSRGKQAEKSAKNCQFRLSTIELGIHFFCLQHLIEYDLHFYDV